MSKGVPTEIFEDPGDLIGSDESTTVDEAAGFSLKFCEILFETELTYCNHGIRNEVVSSRAQLATISSVNDFGWKFQIWTTVYKLHMYIRLKPFFVFLEIKMAWQWSGLFLY